MAQVEPAKKKLRKEIKITPHKNYEFGRIRFDCEFPLVLMNSGPANGKAAVYASFPLLVSEETDFVLIGAPNITQGFRGETALLQTEVGHKSNEPFLTLKITRRPPTAANPFIGGFRKIDGVFQIKRKNGSPLSTTRILILDLNACNTFGCQCSGKTLCYTTKLTCQAIGIKEAIVESNGLANLNVTFNGALVSYGPDNDPVMFVDLPEAEETKLEAIIEKPHDLLITVDGQEFQTQKGILAEQSDVLTAMFSVQMKEAQNGVLEIEDMTAKGIEALLEYFHLGQLNVFTNRNVFFELFHAASKYNIRRLNEALIELSILMPIKDCTLDHAIGFFCYAQYLESQVLENRALKIFNRLKTELSESKSMDSFIKDHPSVVKKLI